MKIAIVFLFAVLLDHLWGEPKRLHPLVGFGNLASLVERKLNKREEGNQTRIIARLNGLIAVIILIAPFVLITAALSNKGLLSFIVDVIVLYCAVAANSLNAHAQSVADAVQRNDIDDARAKVSLIVSRDTSQMNMVAVQRAAIESVLENGSDAIFGALLWYILCGAPGVVLYRLANTLDAIWGYKNDRYLHFGWAAARLDDLLSWIPARLTALTYTILGNAPSAWRCWSEQARTWYSPNAGPVMAAGAGALHVTLGGPAIYHGAEKIRPVLGWGRAPVPGDIERAMKLVSRGIWLWLFLSLLGAVTIHA